MKKTSGCFEIQVRARFGNLVVPAPDETHVRSPHGTASPLFRLRRVVLRKTRPFSTGAGYGRLRGASGECRLNQPDAWVTATKTRSELMLMWCRAGVGRTVAMK